MTESTLSTSCRICENPALLPILSLGAQPLANSLLEAGELQQPERRFPLDLAFCPACSLVQITTTVSPDLLFRDYLYFSSFSERMLSHARAITTRVIDEERLSPESLVVEIASNDGYLLQYFVRAGVPVLGVEPARNIAAVARQRGVRTHEEFFGLDAARELAARGDRADVMFANNVMAHVADVNGMVEGVKVLLKESGVGIFETPYVADFVDRNEFDTIYHEHLCYYSLAALETLFARHGLEVFDVERLDIHGGSLRIFVAHAGRRPITAAVRALRDEERDRGILTHAFYGDFANRIGRLRAALRDVLTGLHLQGRRIAAYGAAAKGAILLNVFGIGVDLIDFAADRNTHKQGRYMPGCHVPVVDPVRLLDDKPDYVLLLAWNFADEIVKQQAEYLRRGGRFIVPVPNVRIL